MYNVQPPTVYNRRRSEIKSGDLLVWAGNGLNGKKNLSSIIIELFTQSSFTHVGVAWVIGGRVFVIEAIPPEVRIFPLSKKPTFYHITMDIEWNENMNEFLLDRVGDPYSYSEVILSYFRSPKDDRKWYCAEFVNRFYKSIGLPDMGKTPKSVVDNALNLGKSMVMVNNYVL